MKQGFGTMIHNSYGERYEGEFHEGEKHGKGTYYFCNYINV